MKMFILLFLIVIPSIAFLTKDTTIYYCPIHIVKTWQDSQIVTIAGAYCKDTVRCYRSTIPALKGIYSANWQRTYYSPFYFIPESNIFYDGIINSSAFGYTYTCSGAAVYFTYRDSTYSFVMYSTIAYSPANVTKQNGQNWLNNRIAEVVDYAGFFATRLNNQTTPVHTTGSVVVKDKPFSPAIPATVVRVNGRTVSKTSFKWAQLTNCRIVY